MSKRHKALYWLFKTLSVVVSCALPMWAIWEKYPIWTSKHGTFRSIGAGGIIIIIMLLIILRKPVFNFFAEKLKLKHAPPIVIWLVLLIISYISVFISNFMLDMTIIFWMGLIGCAIGTVLTFIAENRYGKKEEKKDE